MLKATKIENINVDLKDSQFFEVPHFQRRLSQLHVRRLKASFRENSSLVDLKLTLVKRKNKKPLLIDGQHRWVAMRQLHTEKDVSNPFTFPVIYIEGLNEKDILKLYHNLNSGKAHGVDDLLQGFKETFWIYNKLKSDEEFPVRIGIYTGKFTFTLKKLVQSYAFASTEGTNIGNMPMCARPESIIQYATDLGDKDYNFIKSFFIAFKNCFGEFQKTAVAYKAIYFNNIMRYCYRNRNNGSIPVLLERIKNIVNDITFREMSARIDGESTILFYEKLLRKAKGKMKQLTLT